MNNLKSYTEYAVTTPTTDFVIGFDFNYGTDAVNVTVDDVPATEAGYSVSYLNSTTIRLSPAVPTGVVRLQRETDIDVPDNQFTAGAKFIASNMDENFTQLRHSQQEVRDGFNKLTVDQEQKFADFKDSISYTELRNTVQEVHVLKDQTESYAETAEVNYENSQALLADIEMFAADAEQAKVQAVSSALEAQQYIDEARTYVDTTVTNQTTAVSAALDTQTQTVNTALSNLSTVASKFYPTLAEANADIANLEVNQPVQVGESANGGLYYKATAEATTLTKSPNDPLTQAKNYSDAKASLNSSANILEIRDLYEKLVVLMRGNGDLYIPNLDKSVQKALKDIVLDVADIGTRVVYDDASSLFKIYDSNDKLIVAITNRGALVINDVVTSGGSVDNRLSNLESNAVSDTNTEILKATDYAIAARDKEPMLLTSNLFTQAELSSRFAFAVSLCRIAKNQYITFCESRMGGDFGETKIFTRTLTVNEDYSTTLGAISIVADSGVEATQPYSCINSCSVRVDTGVHAGRVYLYFIKRFYENDRDETFYKYTDDNGLTWSADVPMSQFMPLMSAWRVVAVGPGKAIQLKKGAHAGRIILPCWHGDTNYPTSQAGLKSFILYSDDGGVTYAVGAESSVIGSNECQAAEIDNGNILLLIRDGTSVKKAQVSTDGGVTLQDYQALGDVTTTMVQSGICQFKNQFDLSVPKLIISTPAKGGVREDMGLYVSYDNLNWQFMGFIATGLGSYSDIVPLDESHILVAYSSGVLDQNRNILSVIVNLKQLMLGA